MAFNHYAKIKRILAEQPSGWYVVQFNEPTAAKNFRGELVQYDHYYRVYSAAGEPIKYCKFQKIDKFVQAVGISIEELAIIEANHL